MISIYFNHVSTQGSVGAPGIPGMNGQKVSSIEYTTFDHLERIKITKFF